MTTVFAMSPGAWGAVRFAPSWPWETMLAVRTLTVRHHQAVHQPWLARVDPTAVAGVAPVLVATMARSVWMPDFLSPPPDPGARTFAEQLTAIRATPPERVAAELTRSLASNPGRGRTAALRPLLEDPTRARDVLVGELQAAHDLLIAPWSGRVGQVLDAEVRRRGETAAGQGAIAAVQGVHPSVDARAGAVTCELTVDVTVRCRELVLMPSVFAWPYPIALVDTVPAALAYPVPGVAAVWEEPVRAPDVAARLLGRGRGDVLAALAEPVTTTTIARRLGTAASTVSEHLAVLRDAGLVTSARRGRQVLYRRTPAGAALTTPSDA